MYRLHLQVLLHRPLRERQAEPVRILDAEVPRVPCLILGLGQKLRPFLARPLGQRVHAALQKREVQCDPDSPDPGRWRHLLPQEQIADFAQRRCTSTGVPFGPGMVNTS